MCESRRVAPGEGDGLCPSKSEAFVPLSSRAAPHLVSRWGSVTGLHRLRHRLPGARLQDAAATYVAARRLGLPSTPNGRLGGHEIGLSLSAKCLSGAHDPPMMVCGPAPPGAKPWPVYHADL
jgi:hypothetical protein